MNTTPHTLYIIGNGFDLHHGLQTNTDDFRHLLSQKSIFPSGNALDATAAYGCSWPEYETSLSNLDLQTIEEEHLQPPDYSAEREDDRERLIYEMEEHLASLKQAIRNSLDEMVAHADDQVNKKLTTSDSEYPRKFLNNTDAVISFNYTSTLETLYKIPAECKVLHIHGHRQHNEPLIFGYGDASDSSNTLRQYFDRLDEYNTMPEHYRKLHEDWASSEYDHYIYEQRNRIENFYHSLAKNYQYDRLREFLRSCTSIDRVVVLGHSLSRIDADYMRLIERIIRPILWLIWQYDEAPSKTDLAQSYEFTDNIVTFPSAHFDHWTRCKFNLYCPTLPTATEIAAH